jgi:pimeloyl-[acyl-carrier protein] methyl ester esterase
LKIFLGEFMQEKFFFISGWAGFKELFPELLADFDIIVPFVDADPNQIDRIINENSSEIIIGWSTGAHIILKNIEKVTAKYKNIFLFSPFLNFTKYTDKRILNFMIKKFKIEPVSVIKDFYKNCGITETNIINEYNDFGNLIDGLEYLLNSDINLSPINSDSKIYIYHGLNDKIVPAKASEEINMQLDNSKLKLINAPHFINGEIIRDIINENIS